MAKKKGTNCGQIFQQIQDLLEQNERLAEARDSGIAEALSLTMEGVTNDDAFGRLILAVENGDPKALRDLLDAIEADGIDPAGPLDKGWLNSHLRMATAYMKDSQLATLGSQSISGGSNAVMFFFGPVQETLRNGVRLSKVGTAFSRGPLNEAAKISAEAHGFAWGAMRATVRQDLQRVWQEGISNFSGSLDTYGSRLLTNAQELQDVQAIIDQPFRPAAHWSLALGDPANVALLTNKLQVAARILAFTRPGGMVRSNAGMNRWEAAAAAVGFGGRRAVRAADIETALPWKPALRAMAAADDIAGQYQYLYKLRSDLEVRARMQSAELGLTSQADRDAWVQEQIRNSIYQASPSETDVLAYRKQFGLKGSGLSDEQIAAMITRDNLQGAPNLATEESVAAARYSAEMRFQEFPEGSPNGPGAVLDRTMMSARRTWWIDRYVMPYWKSPFAAFLFDSRMATFGAVDTLKMLREGENASPELVARAKAAWTTGGALLAAFGMLDAAGLIGGSLDPIPAKRNTIFGVRLAGWPLLNTLFLWKDLKDGAASSWENRYDGEEVFGTWMKVMAGTILRQTGIAQVKLLMDAMLDNSKSGADRLQRFAGFMGASMVPGIGLIRQVERTLGWESRNFLRDQGPTAEERFLDKDDPLGNTERFLRNLLIDTAPGIAGALQLPRSTVDHLGSPINHIAGIDFSRAIPGIPAAWPRGEINEIVYGELDTHDMLDPPRALMERNLSGVAMSADLQREYLEIHGQVRGRPGMGPTARLGLAGKSASIRFSMPVEAVSDGVRIRERESLSLPLGQILDGLTAGRTKKEALHHLFTSDLYRRLEGNPLSAARPPGGLPAAERRSRAAQQLIRGITDYYDLLTQDELELRAASGKSPAAADWSRRKTAMAAEIRKRSMAEIEATSPLLTDPLRPAE